MARLAAILTIAAAPLLAVGAHAQPTSATGAGGAPPTADEPGVTVQGPERLVCRLVRRTGTRMRSNRVCRTVTQWEDAREGRTQDEELAEAADRLDALGADDLSTNCGENALSGREHDTPLGPR